MSGQPVKRIIETEVEYEPLSEEERFTEEEQLDQCCEEVSVDECADVGKVSRFISRDQDEWDFDPDALAAEYEKQYGKKFLGVELHAVGPQGDCGVKEETWEGRLNCCDEVEPLAIDTDRSVQTLSPGTSGIVEFTGGRLPVLVKIRGNGFSLDGYNTRDAWAYSRRFRVYAHEFACGSGPITLDDGCTTARGAVRSTLGNWISYWESGVLRSWYWNNHPDIYDCVTNFYTFEDTTNPPLPWYNGEFMLCGVDGSSPVLTEHGWVRSSGRHCSQNHGLVGTTFGDPYGLFTWTGVVDQHIIDPHARLFMAFPDLSSIMYLQIWRYVC